MCRRLSIYLLIILLFQISGCKNGHSGDSDGGGLDASADGKIEIDGGSDTDSDSDSDLDGDQDGSPDGNTDDADVDSDISTWFVTLRGTGVENIGKIVEYRDGKYILGGRKEVSDKNTDIWIIEIDNDGRIHRQFTAGTDRIEWFGSILPLNNSEYIVAGMTNYLNPYSYNEDILVSKIDLNGNVAWSKIIGGPLPELNTDIIATGSNSFQLIGTTDSFLESGDCFSDGFCGDVWILSMDLDGNIIKQSSIGGSYLEWKPSLISTSDGGFFILSSAGSYGLGGDCWPSDCTDIWCIKLDSEYTIEWQKTLGLTQDDFSGSVIEINDGSFIITGQTYILESDLVKLLIVKIDSKGSTQWQISMGEATYNIGHSIIETYDNNIVIGGITNSYGNGDFDIWLLKLNYDGKILWQKTIGGQNKENLYSLIESNDHGLLIAGNTESFGDSEYDAFIAKLNRHGEIEGDCDLITDSNDIPDDISTTTIESDAVFFSTEAFVNDVDIVISETGNSYDYICSE